MTSDAKVGLLLGLIFIFIIAFIINGLPNLKSAETDSTAVSPLTEENLDVAGRTPEAQQQLDWTQPPEESPDELPEETAVATGEPTEPVIEPERLQEFETAVANNVRSTWDLPKVLNQLAANFQRQHEFAGQANGRGTTEPDSTPVGSDASRPQSSVAIAIRHALRNHEASRSPDSPSTTPAPAGRAGRAYVVVEGDTLASIAKKHYGPEEGNRIANIKRIYEVNQDTLESPNDVSIGQKLVIPPPLPPLPKTVETSKPASVLPKEIFERVKEVGGRSKPAQTRNFTGRWYTVQEDDSLWKIASTQLGSGARHEELAKLNADILEDGTSLQIGMKLRLPPK